jgi:hypothetical protein
VNPEDAKLLIAQVLGASKEGIRGTLEALDSHPLGRIAMEMLRAKVRGELVDQSDVLAAIHEATRPK